MTDLIQRSAAKLLAISLLVLTGAVSAQSNTENKRDEVHLKSDQSSLKTDEKKLKTEKKSEC